MKTRNYDQALGGGYEFLIKCDLPGNAERIAAEAIEHSKAKPVGQGLKDLILLPSHLALTIHEIVAHPTELDRIAGYEANYAGTSFIKIADIGKLKYGSPKFNITADRTFPGAMATVGFDDDGVKSQKWQIVKDGILVGLQTNRETAHLLNENFSRGCTFANHWRNYPFLRMPNIQMEAGPAGSPDLDAMIADVKDGVLVDGMGSFSIDQQRYNGQFGGDAFWEIKNGKKTRMVTDFTYNAITTDFWANLDAVGSAVSMAARRHDGRRQGAAGPVQSSVARIVAVPHPPGHGRRGLRVERLRPERSAKSAFKRTQRVRLRPASTNEKMIETYELLTGSSQGNHRQGPEHGEGRRRRDRFLRRRAFGDALCQLDYHRQPDRARSGSHDHGSLRSEVGVDYGAPVR